MIQKTEFIWFDGKLVPWEKAQVSVMTHCLHYGTGVFEGIRSYKISETESGVFRLQDHMKRMCNSGKILGLQVPYSADALCAAALETLKANKLPEGYIRPLAFAGDGDMGVYPGNNPVRVIIAVWGWGAYLGGEALEQGIRIRTSSFARSHVNTMMSKAKAAGNYINSVLAKIEAKEDGYDEAMMLDVNGFVAEGTGENMFIVRNGILKTTPLTSVLDGITRHTVMSIAKDLGYTIQERQFTRDEVYAADEAFFSGTAAEITPIREVDRRIIGDGKRGPMTAAIQEGFFNAVHGKTPKYRHWLAAYSY